MNRLHGWAKTCAALGLLLSLLLATSTASAGPIRWYLGPSEVGDPDTPGGTTSLSDPWKSFLANLRQALLRQKSEFNIRQSEQARALPRQGTARQRAR
jgi:hypothetical protein